MITHIDEGEVDDDGGGGWDEGVVYDCILYTKQFNVTPEPENESCKNPAQPWSIQQWHTLR